VSLRVVVKIVVNPEGLAFAQTTCAQWDIAPRVMVGAVFDASLLDVIAW
jgi:hypothetical protein